MSARQQPCAHGGLRYCVASWDAGIVGVAELIRCGACGMYGLCSRWKRTELQRLLANVDVAIHDEERAWRAVSMSRQQATGVRRIAPGGPRWSKAERQRYALSLRRAGATYHGVGVRLGVSGNRAMQLCRTGQVLEGKVLKAAAIDLAWAEMAALRGADINAVLDAYEARLPIRVAARDPR